MMPNHKKMSTEKELYVLKIKPYAESESSDSIVEFTEDEWELIVDVFSRLIRNFKQTFPEVEFEPIEQQERYLIIKFKEDPDITETELDYHVETLCGHNLDNIIFFDDEEYAIRGNIILDDMKEINKGRKLTLETENANSSSESDSGSESEEEEEEHVVSPTRTTKIKEQKLVVSPTKLKKVISPVKNIQHVSEATSKVSAASPKAKASVSKTLPPKMDVKNPISSPRTIIKKISSPAPKKITSPIKSKTKTQEKKTQEKKTQEKKTQEKKTKNPNLKNLELKNESTLDRFNKIYEHFAA